MSYRVVYTDEVMFDVARRIDQLRENHVSENTISSWFSDLFDTINDLYEMPRLYSIDEPESNRSGFIIRKMGFRNYIVRYRIDEENGIVYVISFIHGAHRKDT